jgi:hypothetical protein
MDYHTIRQRYEEAERHMRKEKEVAAKLLLTLPIWNQWFATWAEVVLCEKNADASRLELYFDADDGVECTEEEQKKLTKNVGFRFRSPTIKGRIYGVLWAHTETNRIDGKFFIWEHVEWCRGHSCEDYNCPIYTQKRYTVQCVS